MTREQSQNPLKTADRTNHGNHLNGLSTRQNRAFNGTARVALDRRRCQLGRGR